MNTHRLLLAAALFTSLVGCSSLSSKGGSASSPLEAQLKVTSRVGRLKAKLVLANLGNEERIVTSPTSRFFKVETTDGKVMPFKGPDAASEPLHLKPGQTVEMAFNLQDNFPFWDRRTKYRIWYESTDLKSNLVHFWF